MAIPTNVQAVSSFASTNPVEAAPRPTVAVVPAAGWGTRLRPLTDAIPKEMLPVGRRVALDRIVDELAAAGMQKIVFVLSPVKEPAIRKYFGDGRDGVEFGYALQHEMRGLGHAVGCAESFCTPGAPFTIALGDAVYEEPAPGTIATRLVDAFAKTQDASVGVVVQRLPRERISRYGVVKPMAEVSGDPFLIDDIVEKPAPEDAPSEYAVAARFVVRFEIFETLRRTPPGKGGEIHLTDALCVPLGAAGGHGVAVPLMPGEVRHDIGALDTYFKAFAAFALSDAEEGAALRAYVAQRLASDSMTRKEAGT